MTTAHGDPSVPAVLDPHTLEALADAIAERLSDRPRFVDVRELARLFGVSADLVYARADELGAVRIGARLIFDVADAANRMRRQPTPNRVAGTPNSGGSTRRRRKTTGRAVELLPIKAGQ